MSPKPNDESSVKLSARRWLLEALSEKIDANLHNKEFQMDEGWFEVDGFSQDPPVLCEIWPQIGMPKSAQKGKIMTDAFKLLFAKTLVGEDARCILLFADERAASPYLGSTWMARCLKLHNIEVEVIEYPPEMRTRRLETQKRRQR